MSTDVKMIATRTSVLVDVKVEADLSAVTQWIRQDDIKRRTSALESAVREFNDFIRDHRSQDYVRLEVVRVVEVQCSACGNEWETMDDEGKTVCAHCATEVA